MSAVLPVLRRATAVDSAATFAFVAGVLAEFGLPAEAHNTDADLANFDAHYFTPGGDFVVLATSEGKIVGSCGLFPVGAGTVELRKMYLAPAWRGRGQGWRLLEWAMARARALGFRRMTLETAAVLKGAITLYERNGFKRADAGRHSCRCDAAYVRDL